MKNKLFLIAKNGRSFLLDEEHSFHPLVGSLHDLISLMKEAGYNGSPKEVRFVLDHVGEELNKTKPASVDYNVYTTRLNGIEIHWMKSNEFRSLCGRGIDVEGVLFGDGSSPEP
ncbi:MAG: hypothetical protein D6732_13565 [Methanobacteriota archaeon]|nr:MAG: hypothetical protein D6732_13565 [Euryarchaeota archaeon]